MENLIVAFQHCKQCFMEKPQGVSMRDFSSLEVGLTKDLRIQVWCKRHERHVSLFPDDLPDYPEGKELDGEHICAECTGTAPERSGTSH